MKMKKGSLSKSQGSMHAGKEHASRSTGGFSGKHNMRRGDGWMGRKYRACKDSGC